MCYMGYLKLIKYKFMEGIITSRFLKIWSDLVISKYLGKKESLSQ